jgi:ArsR family transcriptional regulator
MTATLERVETQTPTAERCCPVVSTESTVSRAQAETYASWFKALSDPTRIQILNLLASADEPVCVCEITEQFPFSQATISHHLKVLREAGLVDSDRRGTWVYYRVVPAALALLAGLLDVSTVAAGV